MDDLRAIKSFFDCRTSVERKDLWSPWITFTCTTDNYQIVMSIVMEILKRGFWFLPP